METKNCQNCKTDFIIDQDDFSFYKKMNVPSPTFCPECRMIRRFHFRNERFLFRRLDAHTGEDTFSTFSSNAPVVTYENKYWLGGDWDPLATGMDYDFSKPFFKQFRSLLSLAPIPSRSVYNMKNSDYCNEASEAKNCYLCFNTDFIEDSAYLRKVRGVKNSFDLYEASESELCYEGVMIDKSYQTFYSEDCESCVDVWFSKRLRGCTNCFGCVNLVNKSNCWFNEQFSKEEYNEKFKSFFSGSYQEIVKMRAQVLNFWMSFPVKYNHSVRITNATGDKLYSSRNLKDCYYIRESENLRYCQDVWTKTSNCMDYSVWGDGAENVYESMTCGMGVFNLKFCFNCWEEARDLEYCGYCPGSNNCFGCVGLYKKQYCIFNKQYTKEEYFVLVEKIKKQMNEVPYVDQKGRVYGYGEFFPYDVCPVAYNESLANDFFPIKKEEVEEKGYVWREIQFREFEKTILAKDLPDNIDDITDEFLKEVIECEICNRAFRIILPELQFYKRMKLPLPRRCHDCRFVDRFKFVNPPKFYHRKCMQEGCQNEFETPYAPSGKEIVYCESCFQQEVV